MPERDMPYLEQSIEQRVYELIADFLMFEITKIDTPITRDDLIGSLAYIPDGMDERKLIEILLERHPYVFVDGIGEKAKFSIKNSPQAPATQYCTRFVKRHKDILAAITKMNDNLLSIELISNGTRRFIMCSNSEFAVIKSLISDAITPGRAHGNFDDFPVCPRCYNIVEPRGDRMWCDTCSELFYPNQIIQYKLVEQPMPKKLEKYFCPRCGFSADKQVGGHEYCSCLHKMYLMNCHNCLHRIGCDMAIGGAKRCKNWQFYSTSALEQED